MLKRVSQENGEWQALLQKWDDDCASFGEDLADYATASMTVIRPLAEQAQRQRTGVYAVSKEGAYLGLCQLNVTPLPGYDGPVLRVRHIVHAPKFDYSDDISVDDYVDFLGTLFVGVLHAAENEMEAAHIKVHFQSPTERAFFASFKEALEQRDHRIKLALKGSWLYMTK